MTTSGLMIATMSAIAAPRYRDVRAIVSTTAGSGVALSRAVASAAIMSCCARFGSAAGGPARSRAGSAGCRGRRRRPRRSRADRTGRGDPVHEQRVAPLAGAVGGAAQHRALQDDARPTPVPRFTVTMLEVSRPVAEPELGGRDGLQGVLDDDRQPDALPQLVDQVDGAPAPAPARRRRSTPVLRCTRPGQARPRRRAGRTGRGRWSRRRRRGRGRSRRRRTRRDLSCSSSVMSAVPTSSSAASNTWALTYVSATSMPAIRPRAPWMRSVVVGRPTPLADSPASSTRAPHRAARRPRSRPSPG